MKHYLITVIIYDGDHEYWDKSIICLEDTDFTSDGTVNDLKVLKHYTGDNDLVYDDWLRAYQAPYTHRGFSLSSIYEIDENDLPTLRKYHI